MGVLRNVGLCVLLLAFGNSADWTVTADTLAKSVVYIESQGGSCTGFVIRAHTKTDKTLVLTAAHCDGDKLFADHATAKVIMKDSKKDLMILETDDLDRPAITFAGKNPAQGQEVGSFGHGYGLETPMFRIAHVAAASIELPDVEGGPFVMTDAPFVGGMSGGPVIDASGQVVMIVQRASGTVGIGIGCEAIVKAVRRYLEKPAKP